MPERDQINLKLHPDQKQKWENYIENDSRIDSMSQLIRGAVEDKINTDEPTGTSDISEESLSEILEAINNVEASVENIADDIQGLDADLARQPDFNELKERVFERMPELPQGMAPEEAEQAGEDVEWLTAIDYAQELDEDKYLVYRALESVRRQYRSLVTAYDTKPEKDPVMGVVYFKEV